MGIRPLLRRRFENGPRRGFSEGVLGGGPWVRGIGSCGDVLETKRYHDMIRWSKCVTISAECPGLGAVLGKRFRSLVVTAVAFYRQR